MVRRLAICAAIALCACGSKSGQDAGPTVDCSSSPIMPGSTTLVSPYAPPMSASSGDNSVQLVLLQSNPAPPVTDQNVWKLKVTDGSGAPLANATVTPEKPYMPFHGHYSDQLPTAQAGGSAQWTVSDVYFFMAGVWRVTFDVSADGVAPAQPVSFYLCVNG